MKKLLHSISITVIVLIFPSTIFGQVPNLGTTSGFILFTSTGAVSNTAISTITGNIGSNIGAISGFGPLTIVNGTIYNADMVAAQCALDLDAAYAQLNATVATNTTHAAVFGLGETVLPGVYTTVGAASLNDTLILDAQQDTTAVFIFKFGGAFTSGAVSSVILKNGASVCNIFWVAEGAVAMATLTNMKGTIIAHNGAASMGASCTLQGRLFSTTGAVSVYGLAGSIPTGCHAQLWATNWTGAAGTANWFTNTNWSTGVPDANANVLIPSALLPGRFFPVIDSGIANTYSLTLQNMDSLSVIGSTLRVRAAVTSGGTFDARNGTIDMNGSSPQIIPANVFKDNNIGHLIISNTVTLGGMQNILGTVSFAGSNDTLFSGDNLVLISTDSGTASISDMTNGGVNTGNMVLGKATVERFISAGRAWRLLSVPISSINAPTINNAWQENVVSGDPHPGYGVQITGGSIANGYDQGISLNPSVKYYNSDTNLFLALPPEPGTNVAITSYPAYFIFVRGNRSTDLLQGVKASLTSTTLRMKGQINTGSIISPVNAIGYTLIGNPYPSAIDFHTITKNNVSDKLYLWDPKLAGNMGYGGYVTLVWNTNSNSYDATASVSAVSRYIPSGAAFFIESLDGVNPGSLTIKETDKNTNDSGFLFRPMSVNPQVRINLYGINADNTTYLTDGVLTTYSDNNSNAIDRDDAKKLCNLAENMFIYRDDAMLAIERRHTILNTDTTYLKLNSLKKQTYKLQLTTDGLDGGNLVALLKDKYAGGVDNIPVNMSGVTDVIFTVNRDSASYAADRFNIVFAKVNPLPVTFTSVKAYRQQKDIVLEWTTTNETNIKNYEAESSANGNNFTTAGSTTAKANNGGSATYNWVDAKVTEGMHYYRIKSIDADGKAAYSTIVKANIDKQSNAPHISVLPNGITGNTINVQLNNIDMGTYSLQLYTMDGKLLKKVSIKHTANNNDSQNITTESYLPPGKYQLQLIGKVSKFSVALIK